MGGAIARYLVTLPPLIAKSLPRVVNKLIPSLKPYHANGVALEGVDQRHQELHVVVRMSAD